jgi:hypothetical protein
MQQLKIKTSGSTSVRKAAQSVSKRIRPKMSERPTVIYTDQRLEACRGNRPRVSDDDVEYKKLKGLFRCAGCPGAFQSQLTAALEEYDKRVISE